jgi:hypothetical protein
MKICGSVLRDDETREDTRKTRDVKAMLKMDLMMKPRCYPHIRIASTATEAWKNLDTAFEDKGLNRRFRPLRSLCSVRLENFNSAESYVNEVMSLSPKLAGMCKAVDDDFIGAIMSQGLPSDYEPTVMALESSGTLITSDFVKSKLHEDSRWGKAQYNYQVSALLNRSYMKHRQLKCWRCSEV